MKVYHVYLDNQREPHDFGLFSTEEKVLDFLRSVCAPTKPTYSGWRVTHYGDFIVKEVEVK
jgi:hypothetical protein